MTVRIHSLFRLRRGPPGRCAQKGATAVEMALLAPVFFLLLMGMVEISLILTTQGLMENAAYNASRLAKTGYSAQGETQQQTVQTVLDNELQSFGTLIDVNNVTMTATSYNDMSAQGNGTAGMGEAGQVVVYTFSYPWKIFTPMLNDIIGTGGIITLTSRIVVQNEPY
ncbi:MAG TPA: TadE/TadG family type IV pilus assembly protein [Alphaproteobacteria bacterium]|nr:TadE/TadG family type IV pilus assembly protein [Alphaproteobacteria bacterium]